MNNAAERDSSYWSTPADNKASGVHDYWSQPNNSQAQPQQQSQMVDTLIGKLPDPRTAPMFNKYDVEDLINTAGGAPGIKAIGPALGKVASLVGNATKSVKPLEEAALKAAQEHEAGVQNFAEKKANVLGEPEKVSPGAITANPKTELQTVEDTLGRYLNTGAAHATRAATSLKNRISDIKNYWSQGYKDLGEKLKGSNFQMPEVAELNPKPVNLADKVEELQKSGQRVRLEDLPILSQSERLSPDLKDLYSKAPMPTDTNAADFLAKYRSYRDKLYNMRQLTKQNIDPLYRKQLFADIKKGEEVKKTIEDTLEQGLGEHAPEFKRLNEGYSKQVYPLQGNPVVKKIMKGKNLSKNMVEELSGNQEGQPLLRDLVKQDPEVLRNVIGQRYSIKPGEVHFPNENMQEYLNEIPGLKPLLESKQTNLENYAARRDISLKEKMEAEKKLGELRQARKLAENNLKEAKAGRGSARKTLSGLAIDSATLGGIGVIAGLVNKLMNAGGTTGGE